MSFETASVFKLPVIALRHYQPPAFRFKKSDHLANLHAATIADR
jgi:hypothetical protein